MLWLLAFLITAYWVDPLPWLDEIILAALLMWFRPDLVGVALLVMGGLWLFGWHPDGLIEHPRGPLLEFLGLADPTMSRTGDQTR